MQFFSKRTRTSRSSISTSITFTVIHFWSKLCASIIEPGRKFIIVFFFLGVPTDGGPSGFLDFDLSSVAEVSDFTTVTATSLMTVEGAGVVAVLAADNLLDDFLGFSSFGIKILPALFLELLLLLFFFFLLLFVVVFLISSSIGVILVVVVVGGSVAASEVAGSIDSIGFSTTSLTGSGNKAISLFSSVLRVFESSGVEDSHLKIVGNVPCFKIYFL